VKGRLRQPLFWIVLGEVVVMFALLVVSWRVYESHQQAASAGAGPPTALAPAARSPLPSPPSPPALKARPPASPAASRSTPSFPIDLGQLNRDQAELERAESALLARIVRAGRDYLETVVLPAVRRAERVNSAISAAATQSPAAIRKMP
jgi:hypothetical protein